MPYSRKTDPRVCAAGRGGERRSPAETKPDFPPAFPPDRLACSGLVRPRLSGRAIESFPVSSGDYIGRVPGYVVFDATAGVRLPVRQNLRLQVTAYNVLDNRHQEFVGAPVIGRLLLTELHVSF